jgi:hypothetical protein
MHFKLLGGGEGRFISVRIHVTLRTSQNAVLPNALLPLLNPALYAGQCIRGHSAPEWFSVRSLIFLL